MATSKVSFVAFEQEIDETTITAAHRKSSSKCKLIIVAVLFLLFLAATCTLIILFTHSNLKNVNETNTSIVINQRVVSTSLNSKIMASKYSEYVIHNELPDAHRRLQDVLKLNDEYDYSWVGNMEVSMNNGATFTSIPVVFDSGSSNFWITSNDFCIDCSQCNTAYQCASFTDTSFTALYPNTNTAVNQTDIDEQKQTWQTKSNSILTDVEIEFRKAGAWTGTATDTNCSDEDWIFCLQYEHGKTEGIYTKAKFKTKPDINQTAADGWISVAYVDTTGVSYHANGVFGLGFSDLSIDIDKTPLQQMVDADSNLATYDYFYMNFDGDSTGYIHFGGKTRDTPGTTFDLKADVKYGSPYFELYMDSMTVDNDAITINDVALLDTGTAFIIGPQNDVITIINKMNSSENVNIVNNTDYGLYTVDCDAKSHLPDIGIKMTIQTNTYNVTPDLYVFSKVSQNTINGKCIIGVKSLDNPHDLDGVWIFGDVYLKTIDCLQFDVANRKILYSSAGCQVDHTDSREIQ